MDFENLFLRALQVILVVLCVVFVIVLVSSLASGELINTEEQTTRVVIAETWHEESYHGISWYVALIIIDDIEMREFHFRSFQAFQDWLVSIRSNKKYNVIEETL